MILKNIIFEDFLQYKKPSMFLIFPYCDFKCDRENGNRICQNWAINKEPNLDIDIEKIINNYISNPITHSIVCGGLEPIESWSELLSFIKAFRAVSNDDIVIYTGYTEESLSDKIQTIKDLNITNIIIKFGRYRPNQEKHYDDILGVMLASDNQYAKRIC